MDSRPSAAELNQTYQTVASWGRVGVNTSGNGPSIPRTPGASTPTSGTSEPAAGSPYPATLDLLPLLFSQHQAQLLQYNKLISPGRGGGGGLQTTSLPGLTHVPCIQAAPRSRSRSSSSKVSTKDVSTSKQSPAAQSCHGTRSQKNTERQNCEGMTMGKDTENSAKARDTIPAKDQPTPEKNKDAPYKMSSKAQPDLAHPLPSRPAQRATQVHQQSSGSSAQSSSVPSTPHQRARNLSFESRDPSPNATQNHSPRSAYSEPNGGAAPARSQRPCPYETASVKFRRRIPYSVGSERLEKIDPDKIKSRLSDKEERRLSTDMREIYDRLLPSPEDKANREKLVQKLERMFNDEWPGHDIQVHPFGSSGNLLCSDDSDVDICITTDWKELEGVCMIADLLHKRGMEKVVCISKAKVPIVKIWDPELKLACDMNVNNTLALENTRMVRTYVEIDDRVRPLAMIIKYWTRRRIVNDAAFGNTLSSYTWICLIIAFLQLREPPVLPALHQYPHSKLPTADGHTTDFADDLDKLRGFGEKNKSSLGELLFEFFRFYAHEFDYEKMALSVRLGKLISKKDKNWHLANNNMLCVEEPFNRERNLGNTADEFSFRGLHLELRRAFDLVAEAKLEECCEQFVFPKEEPSEPKGYVKPAPRPAIIRSSSQQHSGRGGRTGGGGRGHRNHLRNGNSSRRASSSNAYEQAQAQTAAAAAAAGALPHPLMMPTGLPTTEMQWSQLAPHYPYHGDMGVLSNALFAQQDQWKWYVSQHAQMHQHAIAHAQRMQAGSTQQTERSRTNSFDQPPLTAPPRAEYFVWAPHLQPAVYQHHHAGFGTYPNSPSSTTAAPEFRRSLHRSNAANESGSSSSGGTLRSQSQPASRTSAPSGPPGAGYTTTAQGTNGAPAYVPRQGNLTPFPAFVSDDRTDSEADEGSSRTLPDSPPEDSAGYLGYFVADSTASPRKPANGISSYGDVHLSSAHRRKLSTEGPQAVLDKRLQRTSRSPSPLGHGRAVSTGNTSAPLAAAPLSQSNVRAAKESSPLVVNGSTFLPASHLPSSWFPSKGDDAAYDNPLNVSQGKAAGGAFTSEPTSTRLPTTTDVKVTPPPDRPLVVNGSTAQPSVLPASVASMPSFGQRMAVPSGPSNGLYVAGTGDASQHKAHAWQRVNGIAPLDLAITNPIFPESQHLSPVYENRTPSPTAFRDRLVPAQVASSEASRSTQRPSDRNGTSRVSDAGSMQNLRPNGQAARESGTLRGTKGEVDNGSGWQKPKSKKNKGDLRNPSKAPTQSEQPPTNETERKGG